MYIYVMLRNIERAYVLWRQVTLKNSNNQYLIGSATKIQQKLIWSAKSE
jgi:hypothetical protein